MKLRSVCGFWFLKVPALQFARVAIPRDIIIAEVAGILTFNQSLMRTV